MEQLPWVEQMPSKDSVVFFFRQCTDASASTAGRNSMVLLRSETSSLPRRLLLLLHARLVLSNRPTRLQHTDDMDDALTGLVCSAVAPCLVRWYDRSIGPDKPGFRLSHCRTLASSLLNAIKTVPQHQRSFPRSGQLIK